MRCASCEDRWLLRSIETVVLRRQIMKLYYLQKVSDDSLSDTFYLISDKFRTKFTDTVMKHSLSKFTPRKQELDRKDICENDSFIGPSRF